MESNKQQLKEVESKIQPENSETKATAKRVWIRPTYSASVAFSWHEDKLEEINQKVNDAAKGVELVVPW